MRGKQCATAGAKEHERNIKNVERHDCDEQRQITSKEIPTKYSVKDLNEQIRSGPSCESQTETRPKRHWEQRDVWFMVDKVENDV